MLNGKIRGEIIGVYVIGGVALDSHGLGSDVDIVLIVEGSRKLDFTELKIKAAETIGLPVDLVVLSRRDLEYHRGNRTRFNLEPPRGVRISWGKRFYHLVLPYTLIRIYLLGV